MIRIDLNTKTLNKEIEASKTAFKLIEETLSVEGFKKNQWPSIRKKLKVYLLNNLDFIENIPISKRWRDIKKELVKTDLAGQKKILDKYGYDTARTGQGNLLVTSEQNWKATGTMEDTIVRQLRQTGGTIRGVEGAYSAELNVDVSHLKDGYPILVDELLMEKTNDSVGIMRLFVYQQNDIFESLIKTNGDLTEEIFGDKK